MVVVFGRGVLKCLGVIRDVFFEEAIFKRGFEGLVDID